jgi:hypothetical protein
LVNGGGGGRARCRYTGDDRSNDRNQQDEQGLDVDPQIEVPQLALSDRQQGSGRGSGPHENGAKPRPAEALRVHRSV